MDRTGHKAPTDLSSPAHHVRCTTPSPSGTGAQSHGGQAGRSVALKLAVLGVPSRALTSSFRGLTLGPSPHPGSSRCARNKQQRPRLRTSGKGVLLWVLTKSPVQPRAGGQSQSPDCGPQVLSTLTRHSKGEAVSPVASAPGTGSAQWFCLLLTSQAYLAR